MCEDAHPAAVGAVLGMLLVAVEENLLPVNQGRQLLGQLGGGPATASHVQPLPECSHQPAAAQCSAEIAILGNAGNKILRAAMPVSFNPCADGQRP